MIMSLTAINAMPFAAIYGAKTKHEPTPSLADAPCQ